MKIFLKVLQVGTKFLNKEVEETNPKGDKVKLTNKAIILRYGQTILDKERYKELEAIIN